MASSDTAQPTVFNPKALFDKFKTYFNHKFESLNNCNQSTDDTSIKELRNKLEAKDLKPGNAAQFEFCGYLEIALDKIKISLLKKGNIQEAIEGIQEAEELVSERKKKIKIADNSKAGWITVQHLDKTGDKQTAEERKRVQIAEESALKELEGRKRPRKSPSSSDVGAKRYGDPSDRYLFRGICIYFIPFKKYFVIVHHRLYFVVCFVSCRPQKMKLLFMRMSVAK